MILHITIITIFFFSPLLLANPLNSTTHQSKAKRTIADQVYNHGDAKAVLFYMENPQTGTIPELQASASSPSLKNFYSASAKPLALVSVQQPIQVFEQDNPKQVAEQQVLYEFQQTPTNAVSNVHVKQLFQPSNEVTTQTPAIQGQASSQFPTTQSLASIHPSTPIITAIGRPQAPGLAVANNHPAAAATIVSPVHHNIFTNHGLNPTSFSNNNNNNYYNPFLPEAQQFQNTQVAPKEAPGKYIYLNGKIVYNPTHIIPQGRIPPNSVYHQGVYHNQQKLPLINYVQKVNPPAPRPVPVQYNLAAGSQVHRPIRPQVKLAPPSYLPPITNDRFQLPKRFEQIDKPSIPVQKEEAEEDEDKPEDEEDDDSAEDDDEDDEEKESTENQDDEHDEGGQYRRETFPFESDDYLNDDHYFKPRKNKIYKKERYNNEESENDRDEDQDDTTRDASQKYSKFHRFPEQSRRYRNPPKFDKEKDFGFYEGFSMKYKTSKDGKTKGKPNKPIGKYKKIKFSKINGGKPKVETIQGRFSENIPITHKQKVYKERWYVTKDLDGAPSSSHIKTIL